ncbi:MAG: hypothetical protein E7324_02615 [Clostridiales bacterium]|nr:hypothetical protein [Clostridiales bacterium]
MKKAWIYVTVLALLFSLCPLGQAEEGLSLSINDETGEITILENGEVLFSSYPVLPKKVRDSAGEDRRNAIISVTVADKYNNRNVFSSWSGSIKAGGLKTEEIPGGKRMIFDFPGATSNFTVPVDFTFEKDTLRAEIRYDMIENRGDMTITTIALMPYFGGALATDQGYVLIPDGQGALLEYNKVNPEAAAYSAQVYGVDPSLASQREKSLLKSACLPVLGMHKNGRGMLVIAHQGAGIATLNASVPGKSSAFSNAYITFTYTQRDTYIINNKDVYAQTVTVSAPYSETVNPVVLYRVLPGNGDYNQMALAYREYLMAEVGLQKADAGNNRLFARVMGGAQEKRNILGIAYQATLAVTTLSQAEQMAKEMAANGPLSLVLMGFQPGGMYRNAEKLQFDGALGGEKGYRQLQKACQEAGIDLYPMIDLIGIYDGKTGQAAQKVSGDYADRGTVDMMTNVINKRSDWLLRSPVEMKAPMLDAAPYFYELGSLLYGDRKVQRYTSREDAVAIWQEMLSSTENPITDGGNLYALPYVNAVLGSPVSDSGCDVSTRTIPFYQMVVHGFALLAGMPLNEENDPERAFLHQMATGDSISVTLTWDSPYELRNTALNALISTQYSLWQGDIALWQQRAEKTRDLAGQFIMEYQEPEENLSVTTFENGVKIIVNKAGEAAEWEGYQVPAMDYLRLDP